MSVLARWTIVPRLVGVEGVANVSVWGHRDRQLQVQVDPERLRDQGVSLQQVIETTGNALWVSPLTFVEASTPGTGGFIDTPNQRLGIQHLSPISTPADLAQVRLDDPSGRNLRLGDVATVVEEHQPLIGDAVVNDGAGLLLRRREVPGGEHARRDRTGRGRDRDDGARPLRPRVRSHRLPAGVVRREVDRQSRARADPRRGARGAAHRRVPLPVAHGVDRSPRDACCRSWRRRSRCTWSGRR